MSTRVPPLLEPFLALPPETSLIVLTSVLGASTNWLTLRYLYSLLKRGSHGDGAAATEVGIGGGAPEETSIVFVSFLRDFAFWKEGAGRLVSFYYLHSDSEDEQQ
jgi:elongator complex protein 6